MCVCVRGGGAEGGRSFIRELWSVFYSPDLEFYGYHYLRWNYYYFPHRPAPQLFRAGGALGPGCACACACACSRVRVCVSFCFIPVTIRHPQRAPREAPPVVTLRFPWRLRPGCHWPGTVQRSPRAGVSESAPGTRPEDSKEKHAK